MSVQQATDTVPNQARTPDGGLAVSETCSMIGSDKVQGTSVYDREANHLGSIQTAMIDKLSGQVAYVVISFGGLLGIGEHYYPVPWKQLRHNEQYGGYVVDITRQQLEAAPRYEAAASPWTNPDYGQSVNDYYNTPYKF